MWNSILTHTPLLYFTQSFWRDEAFSALGAQHSLGFIIARMGFEPPLYYSLLHFWIKLFGDSEIAVRSLSLLGFALATWVIIEWASELYKKHWLAWYLPLIFFLNPMLLYYAFEARTYAWYTFFAAGMLYGYANKKWTLFTLAAILGFYTHLYLLLFICALGLHWILTERPHFLTIVNLFKKNTAFRSFIAIALAMLPWIIKIVLEAGRLKSSWYFPVNAQLVRSVLGNMFIGYEGTPWYGWHYTGYVSLLLIALGGIALTDRQHRKRTALFIVYCVIPLAVIVGISFIKPLYVNRYLIPATIAEVLIVAAAIKAIRNPWLQKTAAAIMLMFLLWVNWWFPPFHTKTPFRTTLTEIHKLMKPNDVLMADNALIYLETLYYAHNRSRVYLYNPDSNVFPWYIGDALITPDRMKDSYPPYPMRAFLIHNDASYDIVYDLSPRVTKKTNTTK